MVNISEQQSAVIFVKAADMVGKTTKKVFKLPSRVKLIGFQSVVLTPFSDAGVTAKVDLKKLDGTSAVAMTAIPADAAANTATDEAKPDFIPDAVEAEVVLSAAPTAGATGEVALVVQYYSLDNGDEGFNWSR